MSEPIKQPGSENNSQSNDVKKNGAAKEPNDSPMLRIPSALVMMSETDKYEGTVGFKYGNTSKDWYRMSYLEMNRVIGFMKENRELFERQMELERKNLAGGSNI